MYEELVDYRQAVMDLGVCSYRLYMGRTEYFWPTFSLKSKRKVDKNVQVKLYLTTHRGEKRYSSTHLLPWHWSVVSGQHHALAALTPFPRKELRHTLSRCLGGPQSRDSNPGLPSSVK